MDGQTPKGWGSLGDTGEPDAVRRVKRCIELGIYDDPADARAYAGNQLTAAQWNEVRDWFRALIDYPTAG
jgi:hypothetical protein